MSGSSWDGRMVGWDGEKSCWYHYYGLPFPCYYWLIWCVVCLYSTVRRRLSLSIFFVEFSNIFFFVSFRVRLHEGLSARISRTLLEVCLDSWGVTRWLEKYTGHKILFTHTKLEVDSKQTIHKERASKRASKQTNWAFADRNNRIK